MPGTMTDPYIETLPDGTSFEMIKVEGGTFMMGSDNYRNERPVHQVNVPDFFMGKYLVTQAIWEAVMGENPSYFKGHNHPVENVSWEDTQTFIEKLNKLSGKEYRLPSEAEWEYAARGGNRSNGFRYAGGNKLKEVGWYRQNSHRATIPVGLKLSNELGLYDMSGNVWEWCADHWHINYKDAPQDGSAWGSSEEKNGRLVRGGAWVIASNYCPVSFRVRYDSEIRDSDLGFRLTRS